MDGYLGLDVATLINYLHVAIVTSSVATLK